MITQSARPRPGRSKSGAFIEIGNLDSLDRKSSVASPKRLPEPFERHFIAIRQLGENSRKIVLPIFHSSFKHKQMLATKIFAIDQVFESDKSCLNSADNEKGNSKLFEGWGRKIELESELWKALNYSKELPVSCSPSRLLYRKLEAYRENFVGSKEPFVFAEFLWEIS